ncbi:hypothetical protein K491DRAFT_684917 [Lophiostoma macrostomum CBS 122681]|uniref:Arrestin-like N-terminal domain-containing protein n=1 Tax=Lophiostoma macrostomum CBS 122681 TaxID=1314788 RepID=A0A6A6SL65_9PLEO|nr:hypothetical protein K491DRAFT_684917 [Lophiostoma macrostomum CBS 122681]
MTFRPDLRVFVDGGVDQVYRAGDIVKGSVLLSLPGGGKIKNLTVNFIGGCTTKTTRPFYISGNDADACHPRRDYEQRIQYFRFEQTLARDTSIATEKHSWTFEFKFPELTEGSKSRWTYGTKYLKDPHPLPPSFNVSTNAPNGQAEVSYTIHANLQCIGSYTAAKKASASVTKTSTPLRYLPSARSIAHEPRLRTRILYHQTWKPTKGSRTAVDKFVTKVVGRDPGADNITTPRVVPTIHYPEKSAPGQHIPILLSFTKVGGGNQPDCVLDSLNISISTYTTSICGQPSTQPEDTMVKHVKCISKEGLNQHLSFSEATNLTSNFRLVDDAQCVPTFRTYTVTRRYTMTATIGLRIQNQPFIIKSTTPLEILPRIPVSDLQSQEVNLEDEIDPLPLYEPREPSKEFAPDYETLYSLSPTPSTSYSLALTDTRSVSSVSGMSTPSTAPTTPASELDQLAYEQSLGSDSDLGDLMRPRIST